MEQICTFKCHEGKIAGKDNTGLTSTCKDDQPLSLLSLN